MKNCIEKLIAGDSLHKSRFHDEKGHRIDISGMRNLANCLFTTIGCLAFGYQPQVPWLGYRAIKRIGGILTNQSRVLEFGSGMSTIWLARQCVEVVSVESNEDWYLRVQKLLRLENVNKVDQKLLKGSEYFSLTDFPDKYFNFILIDGDYRDKCAHCSIKKVKHGGYIYLDNTDKSARDPNNEFGRAERMLINSALSCNGTFEYFVDFVPTYLRVTEGLLVQL